MVPLIDVALVLLVIFIVTAPLLTHAVKLDLPKATSNADILRNELKDPRVGMITLTGVEVSPDFAHAKVFFTTLTDDAAREETLHGLARAAGFMRGLLGKRMKIHNTPELVFAFDPSVERGMRISKLIDDAVRDPARDDESGHE